MPFTFSHPAIIFPLLRSRKFSATSLIVGSMSPDFEYFFRMQMESEISHSFRGIFLVDFPLGFIVLFAFHEIIKKPLIENSPAFFQKRMGELNEFNWKNYFKANLSTVFISFFLGAVSHILWDSMTHFDGYIVQNISFLRVLVYGIPCYTIAQYLSSIIGLILIAHFIYKLPKFDENFKQINIYYWSFTIALSLVFVSLRFCFGTQSYQIGPVIVGVISPIVVAFTCTGYLFRNKRKDLKK